MSRHLIVLALVAVPGLALTACDSNSTLAKAKPGECYSVVGRDSLGAPKLAKTACAGSPAALAAACPTPAPATVAPGAACVVGTKVVGTKVAATSGHAVSHHVTSRVSTHRRVQAVRHAQVSGSTHYASRDDRVAKSGEVTSLGIDYARVGEDLAGGPGYQGRGYERSESYGRFEQGPPPPPPLVRRERSEVSAQYAERSRQSSSYSESSSSSSSRGGYGQAGCGCESGGRGLPPHSPFDRYGYLTWRGKTPG
jgi:hypothetical protein